MSYQEKRSLLNLISTVLITTLYAVFMIQRYPEAGPYSPEVFRFWGGYFLILVPISIVARIAIYVLFTIYNFIATREEEPPLLDERDKVIERRAMQRSMYVFMVGFIMAMLSLVLDMPPSTMFVILICSGVVSEMVSDISQFFFYRRGL